MTISSYFDFVNRNSELFEGMDHLQLDMGFSFRNDLDLDTPLTRMFAPLRVYIWITTAAYICCAAIIILLTRNLSPIQRRFIIGGRINRTPIFNMICVALGGNIANPRMRYLRYFGTFSRTLTMVWMLSFLILRNAYQCSLYDFLHTQKVASPLDTIEGIKNSDVGIIIDRNGLSFMEQFFDRERYVFELRAMHVDLV